MSDDDKFLRVLEAKSQDVGRGIVRVDPEVVEFLHLREGDPVIVEGRKKTAAIVARALPEDANRGSVRLDGFQRRNAQIGLDEKVAVRPVTARPATKVTLAPTEPIRIMGGEEYLAQALDGRVVTRGDVVSIPVMGRRFEFVVQSFGPTAEAVEVSTSTKVKISEKPAKEVEAKVPRVSYEDIGGLRDEVSKVREMIELPLRHPELFERLGVEAPKGVLLHGPPGTGKTLLAKAVASETNANFHSISGPEIMSKFYGQSEENLRDIFKQAEENAPAIIFIDEIDSIAPKRDEVTGEVERRVVAQLLSLMDGLAARGKVVVIGATNRPNSLDPAIRRPGRLDREVAIGVPDRDGPLVILPIHTPGMPLSKDGDPKELAGLTHGYVGADLAALSKEAAMRSLRRILPDIDLQADVIPPEILNRLTVTRDDFLQAYREMEPSTLREVLIEKPNVRWEDIGGLDEANAITPVRGGMEDSQVTERVISQILTEMDGLEELHNVTVIAATNRMDLVDPALLRPGRFDRHIYIAPPDLATRKAILKIHARRKPLGKDVDLDDIARRTDRYTGAELAAVCNEAAMLAIRETATKYPDLDEATLKKATIEKRHSEPALKKAPPQTGDPTLYSRMPSRFPSSPEVS